ncbi:MAG: ribosome silencing factor [Acidiphilium sp. 21-60-14]|nr:MAG: ribosome silencing factor [Acidiphilium sp. 21-60-14]OYV90396.1 MAG: ribosome silencing factor [Acidiphilium sp. 37-60-79]OZB40471.1 MAG: ribosome silencing factor [Acidiphilium sp. 34-60-192]
MARTPSRTSPPAPATPRTRAPRKPPKPADAAPKAPGTPRKKAVIAGPKKPTTPKKVASRKVAPDRLAQMQAVIVASLDDDKAEEIVVLDLAGRASFADRMVIATGLADRQIAAMATHLIDKLAEIGVKRVQTEGASGSDWVLVDAGDIVVHLFKADARALYALEKMWGADLDEPV